MKHLALFLLSLYFTQASLAALNIKPGLWEISTQMNGKKGTRDPMAHMKEAMAKMKPEQRKQMETMMAKSGMSIGGNGGMRLCYTSDLLKNHETLMSHAHQSKCKTKINEQSSSKTIIEFTCEDGSKGFGEWNFLSSEKYKGSIKMTSAKGVQSEIKHEAKFISSDCGDVKPLGANLKDN